MSTYRKKLIEVAMPLDAINKASAREGFIYKRNPSSVHKWWAQRPLAACRAVLFGQLVDDPAAWPDRFPTEAAQDSERQRLFRIIEDLVKWENSNDDAVLDAARLEIARSYARGRLADGEGDERDEAMLRDGVAPWTVRAYLAKVLPPVHDPFAGGGSIPLEAQRLGLRAIATDLNPVAVMICKVLIEIPPKFAGRAPVGPPLPGKKQKKLGVGSWPSATGLAEDVRRYGAWMREEALKRIGHLYPKVKITEEMAAGRPDLEPYVGQERTVIAWLWARTVASPNPAFGGVHVPLVSNFFLSTKKGKEVWVEPVVKGNEYRFEIRQGAPRDAKRIKMGTKLGRGANFRCIVSGTPIAPDYIKAEGKAGRLGARLMAVVLEGDRTRIYVPPSEEQERIAASARPEWKPEGSVPERLTGGTCYGYGLTSWGDLFTPRQLVALTTFSDLVLKARDKVIADAKAAGWEDNGRGLDTGGMGATAYGDAIALCLAFSVDKTAEYSNQLVVWFAKESRPKGLFARHALPMVWDYVESNPLTTIGGSLERSIRIVSEALEFVSPSVPANALPDDAASPKVRQTTLISTDPPYYDNIGYADLSDFFYVWLRRSLRTVFPHAFATLLVPKKAELVATPYRHGDRAKAEAFFMVGMSRAVERMADAVPARLPVTIYYAFKQSELQTEGVSSTGWEAFLDAVLRAGFSVTGTWPMRTERDARSISIGTNALASSIVLVCRKRPDDAPTITRGDFRRLLKRELPGALKQLQKGNIAPVDLAQASIGPGMAVFSRHAKVLEADGTPMTVRSALQLIHQVMDEIRGEAEGDLDRDTRFALTWFESHGFEQGPYGDAETLAKARSVSVSGVQEAGVLHSAAGKVRLLKREELPADWDPTTDERLTVWEATQHMIKRLDEAGEAAAAALLARLGSVADQARDLAYRLYTICERKGWAEEARAYNGLVIAWPELEKLASSPEATSDAPAQAGLFE